MFTSFYLLSFEGQIINCSEHQMQTTTFFPETAPAWKQAEERTENENKWMPYSCFTYCKLPSSSAITSKLVRAA